MVIDVSRLGPLYAGLGLGAPPATVASRLEAATLAAQSLDKAQLPIVLRAAIGAPVTVDELANFRNIFWNKDQTFAPDPGSPEMRVLAANVVSAVALGDTAMAQGAAIAAGAAILGGLRAPAEDQAFRALIEDALARHQATGATSVAATSAPIRALDLSELLEPAKAAAEGGDLPALQVALAAIVTALAERVAGDDDALRRRLDQLATAEARLAEQMELHWWVVNGHSDVARMPFAELSPAEAVLCAARELAGHTKSPAGAIAAPVLLDRVITPAQASRARMTIVDVATAGPLVWRKSWVATTLDAQAAALCPVTYAVRLATEADDADDWIGRFGRETKTDPATEFDGLDLALQLYREALASRVLVG